MARINKFKKNQLIQFDNSKKRHYDICCQKRSEVECTVNTINVLAIVQHHSSLVRSAGTHDRHAIVLVLRIMSTNVWALFPVNLFFFQCEEIHWRDEALVRRDPSPPSCFTSQTEREKETEGDVKCKSTDYDFLSFLLVSLLPVNRDVTVRSCQWEAFVSMRGLKSS